MKQSTSCPDCDGNGVHMLPDPHDPENYYAAQPCRTCDGKGEIPS